MLDRVCPVIRDTSRVYGDTEGVEGVVSSDGSVSHLADPGKEVATNTNTIVELAMTHAGRSSFREIGLANLSTQLMQAVNATRTSTHLSTTKLICCYLLFNISAY